MPTYKNANFFSIMDTLETARKFGEHSEYLKSGDDIHLIEVKFNKDTDFSLSVNEVEMGDEFDTSEAYGIISSCIEPDNEEVL